jgi:hypothetical protein
LVLEEPLPHFKVKVLYHTRVPYIVPKSLNRFLVRYGYQNREYNYKEKLPKQVIPMALGLETQANVVTEEIDQCRHEDKVYHEYY